MQIIGARERPYDWVIATEDQTLAALRSLDAQSRIPADALPILPGKSREHLFLKIGLSRILSQNGIRTPPFRVANNAKEAAAAARELGYPVMIKIDASSGGAGVFNCGDDAAIAALPPIFAKPVLVQKEIAGPELDLSGIFLEGELVHFAYSRVEARTRRYGASFCAAFVPPPWWSRPCSTS